MPGHMSEEHFTYTAQGVVYDALQLRHAAPRARIVLMPDWEGMHSGWALKIAQRYAATCGAEVILTDHYGVDRSSPSFEQAGAINVALYEDPPRARDMLRAMIAALAPHWHAGGPLVVVGFCSGGSFAFETGRSGAPVDAVFSIHGEPTTIAPVRHAPNCPVFTMVHGAADPIIAQSSLQTFTQEMQENRMRWSLHIISDAKHSFTRFDNPRQSYAIGYSQRAEIEARHLVLAQILCLVEQGA